MHTTYGKIRGEFKRTLCRLPSQTFLICIKYPLQFCISKKAQKPLKDKQLLPKISVYTTGHGNIFFKHPICFHLCELRHTHNANANSYNARAINSEIKWFYKMYESYHICIKLSTTPCQVSPNVGNRKNECWKLTYNPNNLD